MLIKLTLIKDIKIISTSLLIPISFLAKDINTLS